METYACKRKLRVSLLRYSHFPLKQYASFPLAVDTNRRDTATATQIAEIRCISVGVRSI